MQLFLKEKLADQIVVGIQGQTKVNCSMKGLPSQTSYLNQGKPLFAC